MQSKERLTRRQALAGATAIAALSVVPPAIAGEVGPCERLYRQFAAAFDRALNMPDDENVAFAIAGEQPPETWGERTRYDGTKVHVPLREQDIRKYCGAEAERLCRIVREHSAKFEAAKNSPAARGAEDAKDRAHNLSRALVWELLETPASTFRELAFKFMGYAAFTAWCDLDEDALDRAKADAARLTGYAALPDWSAERRAAYLRQIV